MIIGLCPQTVYAENETGQAENSQQTAEQGEGYHFVDLELPKTAGTQSKAGVRAYGAGIPEKYDARSLIGTVRKQGSYQTCWSFAALASAEASLITKGYATNALDLSEYQLAYFFYHHVTDPLGNTEGDATTPLTKDFANQGGDAIKLLDWLVERETFYPVEIHTANPVGRANMESVLARYWGEEYW